MRLKGDVDDIVAELRKRAEIAEQFVSVLQEQLHAAEQRDQQLHAQLRQLTALVEGLQQQLARALSELAARDEKKKKGKRDETAEPEPEPESEPEASAVPDRPSEHEQEARPRRKPKRPATLPEHLPRDVVAIEVRHCEQCGSADLDALGPEVTERYTYVPAEVRVERTERAKCRCRACGTFTTAPASPTAVPNGSMTAALLAHIAYSKCCLHLTLDRIADDLRRLGADFASATMCDAMGHIATLLEPVHDRIVDELFASGLAHLDGTGVKVLMPGGPGSYRGQFTVLSNAEATAYFFSENKEGTHIAQFLRLGTKHPYKGYLVADAASNMDVLYADGTILECGCWYHARDKFVDASVSAPDEGREAIAWIAALFQVEHEADAAKDTVEERRARRHRDTRAVLGEFKKWMAETQLRFGPDEELWKAIQYCDNHWTALTRFLDDGRIPLTNNQAERDLGPIGRGRKAWLFAGSDNGGHRLATIYTVIGTCLRLDIDPRVYLTDVLPRLSTMRVNRGRNVLKTLLPAARKNRRMSGLDPPA